MGNVALVVPNKWKKKLKHKSEEKHYLANDLCSISEGSVSSFLSAGYVKQFCIYCSYTY